MASVNRRLISALCAPALSAVLPLAACAGPPAASPPPTPVHPNGPVALAAPPPCLSVVAWNDLHGQLSPEDTVVDTGSVPTGGVVALADQLSAIRATGDEVVALDAGDLFTGPMESTLAEGAPIIEAYNVMGVDAATLGNHEFDFGPVGYDQVMARPGVGDEAGSDGPRGALLARLSSAAFPFLSANLHRSGGAPPGWRNLHASVRIQRGRYDVGVVGYTTQETPATTLKPNVSDLDFTTAAAPAVRDAIRALRAAGSTPIVLLAHASLTGELPQVLSDDRERTGELATLFASLGQDLPDAVVAGHRHAWMLGRIGGVPIVSSDQHGTGLARLRFCPDGAKPKLSSIERRVALASTPPLTELGAKVAAVIAPWQARVKAQAEAQLGTVPRLCPVKAPNGTSLGELVARAVLSRVGDAAPPPKGVPIVGLINTGALRALLRAGPLRFADLFALLPFENAISFCATTRGDLLRLLANALAPSSARERFPLGIAGARVRIARGPIGELTVRGLEIDGQPKAAGDGAPVWLAVSDFMLLGGDSLFDGVRCSASGTSSTRVRDALQATLSAGPISCDGPEKSVVFE